VAFLGPPVQEFDTDFDQVADFFTSVGAHVATIGAAISKGFTVLLAHLNPRDRAEAATSPT
jgi:hypothetical protein